MLDITSLDLNGDEESSTQCVDHGKLQHVGTNFPFLIQHGKMLSLAPIDFKLWFIHLSLWLIWSLKCVITIIVILYVNAYPSLLQHCTLHGAHAGWRPPLVCLSRLPFLHHIYNLHTGCCCRGIVQGGYNTLSCSPWEQLGTVMW